tara:strand:- start:625 stop:1299 length:675 start_codon:yes stop_codon:yes gene_type:complete
MSKSLENDIKFALETLSKFYNINHVQIKKVLDNNFGKKEIHSTSDNTPACKKQIILPFNYKINNQCCKAIVYNHGLYTQCTKNCIGEVCNTCSKIKYGKVEERIKYGPGEFVTSDGKKEIPYEKFITKMGYSLDEVRLALNNANINYDIDINKKPKNEPGKKPRGRPKKIQKESSDSESKEEIDVVRVEIDTKKYYKTEDNVLLDINTYDLVGVFKNGEIEVIE